MLKVILLGISPFILMGAVVVPDEYKISGDEVLTYIYSEEYDSSLGALKNYQESLLDGYEKEYGFRLDDTLYVGLASNHNQVANGFSTQVPFNSQIFYGAGAGYIDYFCFSSWLKTLLIHETAHNFQLNPKANEVSRLSHKILGNSPFSLLGIFPLFPIPNFLESSFILEGNAVLNESRFGNGGRLFSGYALAEVVALAKANKITPELMYNDTLEFPYREKFYLVGGFFQQFLVKRYGIKKVNGYFKSFSEQIFPFFSNAVFSEQFGKNFETLLSEFVKEIKVEHRDFRESRGELLAQSQIFVPLNKNSNEIYTLISDIKSAPKILKFNRSLKEFSFIDGSWRVGEVFKKEKKYYTQSSSKTSPILIEMGLFDKEGYLLSGTEGKVIQGFTRKGKAVYFDIEKSLETPHIYKNGKFYTQSHSSVYLDKEDNLYYFKQEGENRTLYRNKKALYSYQGHYGFVSDIGDRGEVYFIASSTHGSTVYKFFKGKVERVTKADDILDFKQIDERSVIIATISDIGYSYKIVKMESSFSAEPYFADVFTESKLDKMLQVKPFLEKARKNSLVEKAYIPLHELRHSSFDQALSYGTYTGIGIDVQANFSDPLLQNSLELLLSHNSERDLLGFQYDNVAHQLEYGAAIYGVNHEDSSSIQERNHGFDAYLSYPFLAKGYYRGNSYLSYTKAYTNLYREPVTIGLDIVNKKQFGLSKYPNNLNKFSFFGTADRDIQIVGTSYSWMHDLPWQSYVGITGKYLKSSGVNSLEEKGVELSNTFSSLQADRATINVPSFSENLYAKEVKMAEFSMAKVIDTSYYLFSFPLSLQRNSFYFKQRLYDVDFGGEKNKLYRESIIGLESDFLFLHHFVSPLKIEWIYNPDVFDKYQARFLFGKSF